MLEISHDNESHSNQEEKLKEDVLNLPSSGNGKESKRNILDLPYFDCEYSEMKEANQVKEMISISPCGSSHAKRKKVQKVKNLQQKIKECEVLIRRLKRENATLKKNGAKVRGRIDKLTVKHNALCDEAQKMFKQNKRLYKHNRVLKVKWIHEKHRSHSRHNLDVPIEAMNQVQ